MHKKIRFSLLSLLILSSSVVAVPEALAKNSKAASTTSSPQIGLSSQSALVVDINTRKVIYAINPDKVSPIASITKLMTAMVVLDAKQSLTQVIPVRINQTSELKGVYSRVKVGSEITRKDMLLLALMSSENRAAASLAHNYPGGYKAFIRAMNAKAKSLGMTHTRYVEPTGLSEKNVSTARDLSKLVMATKKYPLLSQLSTTPEKTVSFENPRYNLEFRNTNHLIRDQDWNIQLTKTGFTNKAGHCLTMRTVISNREVALVMLDAYGKYTHFADANRLRNWIETTPSLQVADTSKSSKKQKVRQG
ncbi:D-alanyl-D-alanine endopeptidase [Jinshanibacter sp. LJY008]|uniref:D-alanyl-D-alanine endopeptidase n=1 Tax=Limnobaculum eriocheiris TaxID=2897391 RepID=A0A9X1MXV9_9GAMM|nr:D-alanyl-D-alanine endopeptidase [Limnobaculum eriocheiris]MCD1127666.1 D-alanyl-D-alanine endopeptidase [Limnobaculum eriocheiris]